MKIDYKTADEKLKQELTEARCSDIPVTIRTYTSSVGGTEVKTGRELWALDGDGKPSYVLLGIKYAADGKTVVDAYKTDEKTGKITQLENTSEGIDLQARTSRDLIAERLAEMNLTTSHRRSVETPVIAPEKPKRDRKVVTRGRKMQEMENRG